jgi:hypothetical protein
MHAVTDLSILGWTPDRAIQLPPNCVPSRAYSAWIGAG